MISNEINQDVLSDDGYNHHKVLLKEYFCFTCNESICHGDVEFASHQKHNCQHINQIIKDINNNNSELNKRFQSFDSVLRAENNKCKSLELAAEEIEKFFKQLNEFLLAEKTRLIQSLNIESIQDNNKYIINQLQQFYFIIHILNNSKNNNNKSGNHDKYKEFLKSFNQSNSLLQLINDDESNLFNYDGNEKEFPIDSRVDRDQLVLDSIETYYRLYPNEPSATSFKSFEFKSNNSKFESYLQNLYELSEVKNSNKSSLSIPLYKLSNNLYISPSTLSPKPQIEIQNNNSNSSSPAYSSPKFQMSSPRTPLSISTPRQLSNNNSNNSSPILSSQVSVASPPEQNLVTESHNNPSTVVPTTTNNQVISHTSPIVSPTSKSTNNVAQKYLDLLAQNNQKSASTFIVSSSNATHSNDSTDKSSVQQQQQQQQQTTYNPRLLTPLKPSTQLSSTTSPRGVSQTAPSISNSNSNHANNQQAVVSPRDKPVVSSSQSTFIQQSPRDKPVVSSASTINVTKVSTATVQSKSTTSSLWNKPTTTNTVKTNTTTTPSSIVAPPATTTTSQTTLKPSTTTPNSFRSNTNVTNNNTNNNIATSVRSTAVLNATPSTASTTTTNTTSSSNTNENDNVVVAPKKVSVLELSKNFIQPIKFSNNTPANNNNGNSANTTPTTPGLSFIRQTNVTTPTTPTPTPAPSTPTNSNINITPQSPPTNSSNGNESGSKLSIAKQKLESVDIVGITRRNIEIRNANQFSSLTPQQQERVNQRRLQQLQQRDEIQN